jgi:prepilin-type N-terminal cleavage/methylation domain-containing protein
MSVQILIVKHKGFTLMELLITLSIIAILAVVAVPTYSKYRTRAKVATMVSAASAAQFAVATDYFNNNYSFAKTTFTAGSQPFLQPKSNFISSMYVQQGWVWVNGNSAKLGGRSINLAFGPTVVNNSITWTCYAPAQYFEYVPETCRNTGCAVYTWGPWRSIDQGTTWLYNGNPANIQTTWANYCANFPWYFGCTCYNATDTNLNKYQIINSVVSNVDNGWGWTYLVVKHDCQQASRQITTQASCGSCPGGATCQDVLAPLGP